jgi:simple sugar transport system substrate-binding protein
MKKNALWRLLSMLIIAVLLLAACSPAATPQTEEPQQPQPQPEIEEEETLIFGMLLVGPYNDRGWSQAHYEAGEYVESKLPGSQMIYVDKVNPADRPGTTPAQLAEELMAQGASVFIFNSDDMKDSALDFARANPDAKVIHASGDSSWVEGLDYQNLPNLVNLMGMMEYGKMIAGCTAVLTTDTGRIGYLGPLINDETRRLTASAYLGARYCWDEYLGNDPADLTFRVTWIGFWFNIPGVTSDPTQVATEFFNSGFDVVISGIDTTEALTEAKRLSDAGQRVWAIPYDYEGACAEAPDICLGVPYFHWGPSYLRYLSMAKEGNWTQAWEWMPPDWSNINNPDTTAIGFHTGNGLSADNAALIDDFIAKLAGGLNLFTGPLNLQDGTPYLAAGEVATEQQIWYLPQLLEGMEGQSVAGE